MVCMRAAPAGGNPPTVNIDAGIKSGSLPTTHEAIVTSVGAAIGDFIWLLVTTR